MVTRRAVPFLDRREQEEGVGHPGEHVLGEPLVQKDKRHLQAETKPDR
jgi:hypothetical protein